MVCVVLDSQKHIHGLKSDEVKQIKKSLTFDNPKYIQAVKYSKYPVNNIPKFLYLYSYNKGVLSVPIGYKIPLNIKAEYTDKRVYGESVSFPPFLMTLRDDQQNALNAYISQNVNEPVNPNGVIQLETGKGKSITALSIIAELQLKTLIVVHKDDLVDSWNDDITDCFGKEVETGLIKAKSRKIGQEITIATAQTLNRLSDEYLEELYNTFGIVVHDECHNCASTHFSITSKFRARYKIGLSATPERSDGLTEFIFMYFGGKCYESDYDPETDTDILPVEVRVRSIPSVIFNPVYRVTRNTRNVITAVHKRKGDIYEDPRYQLKDNELRYYDLPAMKRPDVSYHTIEDAVVLNQDYGDIILNDIMYHYDQGHSIVVFISKKEHCEIYYSCLHDIVGDDVQLYYGDSKESNSELRRRAEEHEVAITITTLKKATEGTNVKEWAVGFLVSSVNNGKNVEQLVGRVRRTKEGKISPCIVYDYRVPNVLSMARHGKTRDERYAKMKCSIVNYD